MQRKYIYIQYYILKFWNSKLSNKLFFSFVEKSLFYSKGFIISHENTFEMIEISSVNGVVRRSPQLKDTAAIIQSFVVNADKELIYFIDSKNRVLKELDIKTQQIQILTSLDNGRSKSISIKYLNTSIFIISGNNDFFCFKTIIWCYIKYRIADNFDRVHIFLLILD